MGCNSSQHVAAPTTTTAPAKEPVPTSELVLPVESKQSDVLVVDTAVSTPAAPPPASVSLDPAATAVDTVIVVEERLPEEESAPIVAEQVVIVEPSPPADIAVPVPTDAVVADVVDAPADPIMSVEEVQRQEEVAVVEPILVVDQPPSITSIISPQSPEKLAKSECARIGAIHEDITKAEVDSLRQLQPLAVTDAGVGEELCKAVTGVCRNNAKNRMICGTPIINQLKDVVKAHMNKPGVVEAGVYALGWIAHANSDNMAAIISSDALATVYAVMEAHPASAAIQRAACQTLRTYANDSAAVVVLGSDGRAVPLLNAAKENMSGDMFVPSRAYDVLKKITGISP